MSNIDKQAVQAVADLKAGYTLCNSDVAILNELARIALASLEVEPVAYIRSAHNPDGFCFADGIHPTHLHQRLPLSTLQDGCYWKVTPLYTAHPAPVSDSLLSELLAIAKKAADAADECAHAEWSDDSMEHSTAIADWERRAAMLQGAEPVSNLDELPEGWVACSERMPENDDFVYIWPRPDFGVELHVAQYGKFDKRGAGWYAQVYEQNYGIEYHPITVTHWMPLPAAPQQEAE